MSQDVNGFWSVMSIYEANNFAYLYRIGASETRYARREHGERVHFCIGATA